MVTPQPLVMNAPGCIYFLDSNITPKMQNIDIALENGTRKSHETEHTFKSLNRCGVSKGTSKTISSILITSDRPILGPYYSGRVGNIGGWLNRLDKRVK